MRLIEKFFIAPPNRLILNKKKFHRLPKTRQK